ncbi:hypothetical protein HPP92_019662 [Vanilla planifolia]|uniref:Uncharacterized protein n=1 Tax=Vanilla planifolia TaxID=51239 RepID=A0A835QAR1_VANPL|nr:hypothetical protein HPP92_019662 [Vanilla planifolia]
MEMECCFHPEEPKSPTLPSLRQKIRSTISSCFRCGPGGRSFGGVVHRKAVPSRSWGVQVRSPATRSTSMRAEREGRSCRGISLPKLLVRLPATPPHHAFV